MPRWFVLRLDIVAVLEFGLGWQGRMQEILILASHGNTVAARMILCPVAWLVVAVQAAETFV